MEILPGVFDVNLIDNSAFPFNGDQIFGKPAVNFGFHKHIKEGTCDGVDHSMCDIDYEWLIGYRNVISKEEEPELARAALMNRPFFGHQWELDPEARYHIFIGLDVAQVGKSDYVIQCAMASPCYPDQGDITTEGDVWTYAPHPWLIAGAPEALMARIKRLQDVISQLKNPSQAVA